jgi:hypothetical protein
MIIAASLVTGAVLLYAGVQLGILSFLNRSSGDEPPITVKHGSIDLNVVSTKNHQKWDKQNGKAYWGIKDKTAGGSDYFHNQDHYDVLVGYTFATDGTTIGCDGGTYASAKKVVFTYHQKAPGTGTVTATVEVVGGMTQVTTSADFGKDGPGRMLSYGKNSTGVDDGGFISEIDTDGNIWCKFDAAHLPTEIALLDGN